MNNNGTDSAAANAASLGISLIFLFIWLALIVLIIASMWKVFTKAGKPGWASLIPIYNLYVLNEIGGKPGWWLLLYFIPIVNIVISILVLVGVAQNFGKGAGFAIGLIFLPMIFYPILAFSDAEYVGSTS
jgi:hypothetical protein